VSRGRTGVVTIIGVIVLSIGCLVTGTWSPRPNAQFKDAAAALTLTAAIAVGIERLLEGFWTVVGQLANTWWPLNVPARAIESLVGDMDTALQPLFQQADAVLKQLGATGAKTQEELANAGQILAKLKDRVKNLQPGGSDIQLNGALVRHGIDYLGRLDGQLSSVAKAASGDVNAALNFLVTFQNNPGRRLLSLLLGAGLGLAVCGTLGLDLIGAAAGVTSAAKFHWGVAASGIVVGLGSNPTHEIIRSIQEYKNSKKAA
jgi:hypothetical protein